MGLFISRMASRTSNRSATQRKRQFPTRIPQFNFLKQHGESAPMELDPQSVRVNDKLEQLEFILRDALVNHHDGLHSPHNQRLQQLQTGLPSTAIQNGLIGGIVHNPSKTLTSINKAIEHNKIIFDKGSNLTDTSSKRHNYNKPRSISTDIDQNQPVLFLLARQQLAAEADAEFSRLGKRAQQGRQFLDVGNIRRIIEMRDEKLGITDVDIEKKLGLKTGTVMKLGNKFVVSAVN